jgi:DNA-binding GntR family transcriptional regulator
VDRNEITAALGLSRVPVQEALIQLEHDGILVTHYHRGAFVAAGLFYLLLTIPLTHLVNYIDARLRRGRPPSDEDPLDPNITSQEMV